MPPDAKLRPVGEPDGVENTSGGVAAEDQSSTVVANATCCPLACLASCTFRCPLVTAYGRALFRVRAA